MLRRQNFIAVLLIAVFACVYLSPQLVTDKVAVHHSARVVFAPAAILATALLTAFFSFFWTAPGARAYRSQDLLALHCARLC
jgi:hypothetical protein